MNNLLCLNCCKKGSTCCICSEQTRKGFKCKICNEGFVCRKCMPQLCESGLCNKCPVCRQVNWRDCNVNQTIIIPIKQEEVVILQTETDIKNKEKCIISPCNEIMHKLRVICCIIFISYIIGVFTISDYMSVRHMYWPVGYHILALLIGFCEFCIISYCCYRSLCSQGTYDN
jgi:hypothetical protein